MDAGSLPLVVDAPSQGAAPESCCLAAVWCDGVLAVAELNGGEVDCEEGEFLRSSGAGCGTLHLPAANVTSAVCDNGAAEEFGPVWCCDCQRNDHQGANTVCCCFGHEVVDETVW